MHWQWELLVHELDVIRVRLEELVHQSWNLRAEGALKVGELDDGHRRARRAFARGAPGGKAIHLVRIRSGRRSGGAGGGPRARGGGAGRGGAGRQPADKVRGPFFSFWARRFDLRPALVPDLSPGSGTPGMGALGRGPRHVTFVDESAASIRVLRDN